MTPLILACITGNAEMLAYLLSQGANVLEKDKYKRSGLIIATRNGHTEALEKLLIHGGDFEAPDSSQNYPIHYAAAYGQL